MRTNLILLGISMLFSTFSFAQEEGVWEAQKQITGYISTEANYINNLDERYFDRHIGVNVAEAGILFNYKPLRNLTIKSVMVYRPNQSVQQMINELSAEWAFSDALKVGAGRMLTPLSPVNTYFYAPVNLSVTLPILISHHVMYPINFEGLSLNGVVGNDLKVDYNVFGGGFYNSLWLPTGPIGFFGRESDYFSAVEFDMPAMTNMASDANMKLSPGGGAHLAATWKDMVHVGANYFHSDEIIGVDTMARTVTKDSYGVEFGFNYKTFKLSGEYWRTDLDIALHQMGFDLKMHKNYTAYYQISNSFGPLTPYVTYETNDMMGTKYSRIIGGLNYKPIFETTLKLEYFQYDQHDVNGLLFSLIYSF